METEKYHDSFLVWKESWCIYNICLGLATPSTLEVAIVKNIKINEVKLDLSNLVCTMAEIVILFHLKSEVHIQSKQKQWLSILIFKAGSSSSIWKNCLILFSLSHFYQLWFSRQAVHHQFGRITWSYFPYPISINSDF